MHGGGIAAEGTDEVTIFQSRVIFNKATAPAGSDSGGGMLAANVSDLSITYSTFASNTATSGNGGLAPVASVDFPGGANAGLDDDTFGGFTDPNSGVITPNSAGGFGGSHLRQERDGGHHPPDVQRQRGIRRHRCHRGPCRQ